MTPANGHSGTSQPANGIDGRVNVLEKDHAVTRTQLESLTGSVATLGKEFTALKGEVTHGFSRLESLVVRADANSKSFGKFTIGQALALTSPAVAVVGIVGALLMYVIRTEIGIERREREAGQRIEQVGREAADALIAERIEHLRATP